MIGYLFGGALESYFGMIADYPKVYTGKKDVEFLKHVSTTWDESLVIDEK